MTPGFEAHASENSTRRLNKAVAVVMPATLAPADAHDALTVRLASSGHWWLMLMMLLLWVVGPRKQGQLMHMMLLVLLPHWWLMPHGKVVSGGDTCKARTS